MHDFSLSIRIWYRQNCRNLDWRNTKNPYLIWLSEVILQQTKVEQGKSYYTKFVSAYPKVKDLADADEQEILNLWQGLGYYSRARNLHFAARQVMKEFNGKFPSTYKEIKSLKGVGDYTASAISSFAFRLPHAVVDGNVYRVLSRYYADDTPIDTSQGQKLFKAYAQELLPLDAPDEFNQAIMELGALTCTPAKPKCESCPVSEGCSAYLKGEVSKYPVKSKKTKVTEKYFNYFVGPKNEIHLEKREGKGIWQNMYQLPLIESEKPLSYEKVNLLCEEKWGIKVAKKKATYTHILSHQKIHAAFWQLQEVIPESFPYVFTSNSDIQQYPIPKLIDRYFEENTEVYGK